MTGNHSIPLASVDPRRSVGAGQAAGTYIDPNPIPVLDGQGHNYFRSQNPYRLNSYAGFGEAYYQVAPDVKLTAACVGPTTRSVRRISRAGRCS